MQMGHYPSSGVQNMMQRSGIPIKGFHGISSISLYKNWLITFTFLDILSPLLAILVIQ